MLVLKNCISNIVARLGGLFCDDEQVIGFMLLERGLRFDPATFSKTLLDEKVQQDKVIGMVEIQSAEDANVEVSYTETNTGESIQNHQGLKKWNIKFYKGGRWQNELQKLNKSERYSVVFVMRDGSTLWQQNLDGTISGFDVKLFTGIRMVKTAAEGGGSSLRMDLTVKSMSFWQESSAIYKSTDLDFRELQSIEQIDMKVPVLSAGATTTVISITRSGSNTPMVGLDDKDNWKIVVDGVEGPITALTSVGDKYTFTHAALVTNKMVYFKTMMDGYPIYVLSTGYYVGESIPKKVV
ncbi:hypothetical protein [Chryseobacterium mucoviscidosis]|uniref:hypothetical protein n=1 Tax=Chryseobacterium mucoviscidosis TaxID=1945581 RepID=UPI003015E623